MARVYLLANVLPGKDVFVRDTIRGIKGVISADVITGHYDISAKHFFSSFITWLIRQGEVNP